MSGSDADDGRSPSSVSRRSHALSRRTLLQAALLSPAAIPMAREAAGQATPGAGSGTGGGGSAHATPAAPPAPSPTPIDISATESWLEPWVWRPGDWPGQQLELNVVENQNPGDVVGFGNPSAILFSYNGSTPGPTIRMRGDETLFLRLRNMLGMNYGSTYVGPYPDPKELPENVNPQDVNKKAQELGQYHPDYCIGEHVNGTHATRTTNLHTHGLHVRPGRNRDGTHSDNVNLRLIDSEDLDMREAHGDSPGCAWLRDPEQITYLRDADEIVGFADYEFHIGDVQSALRDMQDLPPQPHPPGTHWYPPHRSDAGSYLLAECFGCETVTLVKDVDGLYDRDPKEHPTARFIDEITVGELRERNLPTLPFDRALIDLLANARLVTQVQIINGLEPDRLAGALRGERVGTIVRKDDAS